MSERQLAKQLLGILYDDRAEHLLKIDRYKRGEHDDPYKPDNATEEYKLLARRARSNWMPLVISAPAQALYVDGFRRGRRADGTSREEGAGREVGHLDDEWSHWQRSRLDSRQNAIHEGALTFGHSFTITERKGRKKNVVTSGLSALRTSALFEDPANDLLSLIHI